MVNILLHGCNGRMGRVITGLAKDTEDIRITAGIDAYGEAAGDYPVYATCDEVPQETIDNTDVVVDFSTAAAMDALLHFVGEKGLPCVLCTTGLSEAQTALLQETAQKTAILKSANMSVGINLLLKLLKENAAVLDAAGFDIEIVEKHHRKKLDAPSGTAIALGDAVNESLQKEGKTYPYIYGRADRRSERPQAEIGISAVRGGTIVGDHDVIFAGTDEVVTLSHRAYSRDVFATGAIAAARYLKGKAPGLYGMDGVVG